MLGRIQGHAKVYYETARILLSSGRAYDRMPTAEYGMHRSHLQRIKSQGSYRGFVLEDVQIAYVRLGHCKYNFRMKLVIYFRSGRRRISECFLLPFFLPTIRFI